MWQKSREMARLIYRLSGMSKWKDRSLTDQIRRAAVSVLSNIAEGFERGTKEEFVYFLYVARGSCGEVRAQLYVALDQGYVSREEFDKVYDLADFTSRLLAKFIGGYKLKGHGGQKFSETKSEGVKELEKEIQMIIKQGKG